MKKLSLIGAATLFAGFSLVTIPAASADARDDARFIVEATLTEEFLGATMGVMAEVMASSMAAEFAKSGVNLSDEAGETMLRMMMPTLIEGMRTGMTDDLIDVYLNTMSPESLSDYRKFLETPSGQEVLSSMPAVSVASAEVGGRLGQSLGLEAANAMIDNIITGNYPVGTSQSVQSELSAIFSN